MGNIIENIFKLVEEISQKDMAFVQRLRTNRTEGRDSQGKFSGLTNVLKQIKNTTDPKQLFKIETDHLRKYNPYNGVDSPAQSRAKRAKFHRYVKLTGYK